MVEYLKYIKEFLRHEREKYGVLPCGLDMPFDKTTYYGMVEGDLGICDNNSFYLLHDFNKRNLRKTAFKGSLDLGNMDEFYYDLLSYMSACSTEDLNGDIAQVLNEEQRKFYEAFLGIDTTMQITDSGILLGSSDKGLAYVYTQNVR